MSASEDLQDSTLAGSVGADQQAAGAGAEVHVEVIEDGLDR